MEHVEFFRVNVGTTNSHCKLKDICTELNHYLSDPKSKSKGRGKRTERVAINNDQLSNIIDDMLTDLSEGDGVSTLDLLEVELWKHD